MMQGRNMKAKETIMPEEEIRKVYMGTDYHPTFSIIPGVRQGVERVAKAQAEIAFKAGFKAGFDEGVKKTLDVADSTYGALLKQERKAGIREVLEWADQPC